MKPPRLLSHLPRPQNLSDRYTSPLHHTGTAAWLGLALGTTFSVCFITGVWSHLAQDPPSWFTYPARPAGMYRITQGLHVATGTAAIPLLLAKLWVVAPRFTEWPPARSLVHAVERLALLPLVGGGLFMLFSGMANVARWYPWTFFFPRAHFWVAWLTIGALIVHVGAKVSTTRDVLRRAPIAGDLARPDAPNGERDPAATARNRRAFLAGVAATSGALVVVTVGDTLSPLNPLSVLAQRERGVGPQGVPVNKSASNAGVLDLARSPDYRLVVEGTVDEPLELSLADLQSLDQHEARLPIACVEGWSASARWRGVRVRDLLDLAGASTESTVTVESLQPGGRYRSSELNPDHREDPDTLLALELNGEPLHIDHGFPIRLIGPNRPGVMQTKWVARLVVA